MKETDKTLTQTVGNAIYTRRKALGISQEVLSEMVGIEQQSLSKMEQGKIAPKFERLQLFADALQCSVIDLFYVPNENITITSSRIALLLQDVTEEQKAFIFKHIEELTCFITKNSK